MKSDALLIKNNKQKILEEASTLTYLLSLLPAVLVIIGNLSGGYFTTMNILLSGLLLPIADWVLPANVQKTKPTTGVIPDFILLLAVVGHTLSVASLIFGIYTGIISD